MSQASLVVCGWPQDVHTYIHVCFFMGRGRYLEKLGQE